MAQRLRHGFRLGNSVVYPLTGRIEGSHGSVRVRPETMAVLMRLVRSSGELVGFEDILAEVWPDGSGSEEILNGILADLRDHLGDSISEQRIIRSHPSLGLELVAGIGELDSESDFGGHNVQRPGEMPTISE